MRFNYSSLELTSAVVDEPVSLDEAKAHLRVDTSDDDSYILGLITASRQYVEQVTRRALLTQSWVQYYDAALFPVGQNIFFLAKPPLQSVTSIKYVDQDGTEQTVSSSVYEVDTSSEPARVYLAYNQNWPTDLRAQRKSIYVTYAAGYGDPQDVPAPIVHAIKLLISHLFETREPVVFNQTPQNVPISVGALLAPYTIQWEFAD